MEVSLTSSNTLEFPALQRGRAGNDFLQEGYCSEECEILLKISLEEKVHQEHSSVCLWHYFWISQPLFLPIHLTNWEKQLYSDTEVSPFDSGVSVVTQMSLSLSFAATTFPVPHLATHTLAVSKVRSETVQPWKYGTGFFRCSSTWTNSAWQHLNPFFRLLSCLSYYKYLQNREFGPNIAKYLQLYVWGSGSICRYLKFSKRH